MTRDFFAGSKPEKRRNTLCISSFSGEKPVKKTHRTPKTHLFGVSLVVKQELSAVSTDIWHKKKDMFVTICSFCRLDICHN